MKSTQSRKVFYIIVAAQFCGTSLWFAGNAVLPQLQAEFHWPVTSLGYVTSATQLGFILGTLAFAVSGVSDRFSPSNVFFVSSLCAALSNLLAVAALSSLSLVLVSRLLTGFFLAGIYPVGMKIASDWKQEGLGHWLGALVGALVLGTAFPHALKLIPGFVAPATLLVAISLLAVGGACLLWWLVPDGPFRKKGGVFSASDVWKVFRIPSFRAPALGYFGHMWELYTFWTFIPTVILLYQQAELREVNTSLLAFLFIAAGAAGCVAGGLVSLRTGSAKVAALALACSGVCCALSPFAYSFSPWLFVSFMVVWGITVAADSPQFSALVARNAPDHLKGSAITLVTCIGFTITIFSIQLINYLQHQIGVSLVLLVLLPGPVAGVIALMPSVRKVN